VRKASSICSMTFISGPANISMAKKAPQQMCYKGQYQLRVWMRCVISTRRVLLWEAERNEHSENKQCHSYGRWRGKRRGRKNWWGLHSHFSAACLFPGGIGAMMLSSSPMCTTDSCFPRLRGFSSRSYWLAGNC